MPKSKHTRGPWRVERIGANHHNGKEKGMAFRIVAPEANTPERWDIAVVYFKPDFGEAAANARALAAAPALDKIHKAMSGAHWSPDTLDRIADILTAAGYTIEGPDEELEAAPADTSMGRRTSTRKRTAGEILNATGPEPGPGGRGPRYVKANS